MIQLAYVLINRIEGRLKLTNPPRDWSSTTLQKTRDAERHGMLGTTGGDLDFTGDGADYLINIIDSQGTEAEVALLVYLVDPETEQPVLLTSSRLNLALYKKKHLNDAAWSVTINTDLSNFAQRLTIYDDTPINLNSRQAIGGESLPAYGGDPAFVWLRPQGIRQSYEAAASTNQPIYSYPSVDNSNERSGNIYIGLDDVVQDDFNAFTYATGVSVDDEEFPFIEFTVGAEIEVTVELNYQYWGDQNRGDFDEAELWHWFGLNNPRQFELHHEHDTNAGGTWSRSVNAYRVENFTVVPGDKLFCFGRIELGDTSGNYEFTHNLNANGICRITVRAVTKKAETMCYGYFAHEALARTLSSMTGVTNPLYSEYLGRTDSSPQTYAVDGPGSLLFIANGGAIRGIPQNTKPPYVQFAELWRALANVWGLGLGVETLEDGRQRARVEPLSFFYDSTVVLALGNSVTDFVETPYDNWRFHQVTTGYKKYQSQGGGSADEFNGSITRTTPATQHKKSLELISPYLAAGTLIELHRRKPVVYGDQGLEDESEDSDNFLICVERKPLTGGGFRWQSEDASGLLINNGLTAPSTVYNWRISPTRNLLRFGEMIGAGLTQQRLLSLTTAKVDGNGAYKSQAPGEAAPIQENQVIPVSSLGVPFAEAIQYTFNAPLILREWAILNATPYGVITFVVAGVNYSGYLLDVKYKPSEQSAIFTLLKTA